MHLSLIPIYADTPEGHSAGQLSDSSPLMIHAAVMRFFVANISYILSQM